MILVLLVGILLVGMCATLVGRAVALPRLSGAMDGVARRLGGFFAGRLRGISEAELRRELLAAGMYRTSPTALAGYRIISAISFPVAALWLGAAAGMQGALVVMTAVIAPGVGWLAPPDDVG